MGNLAYLRRAHRPGGEGQASSGTVKNKLQRWGAGQVAGVSKVYRADWAEVGTRVRRQPPSTSLISCLPTPFRS